MHRTGLEVAEGLHLHLDALGGLAGDMFAAALLDLRPELTEPARELVRRVLPELDLAREETTGGSLRGSRVRIALPSGAAHGPHFYREYDALLDRSAPDPGTSARARDILRRLAEAEASVHGVSIDAVHFHEVADWDSVADILLAAWLLEVLGIASASAAPLPLGAGRIKTQHGLMPVPAPATLELLKDAPVIDDGIPGERITPTGAAIYAHLKPLSRLPDGAHRAVATGYGFGHRRMQGVPNAVRATLWQAAPQTDGERIGVISFSVDDQSPEDLAVGLDRIRAAAGVVDVLQIAAIGKKGRLTARIEVLCVRERLEEIARLCLAETSTIGVRMREERRMILAREHGERDGVRVKRATRPDGSQTAKAEMDDIAMAGDHAARQRLRRQIED